MPGLSRLRSWALLPLRIVFLEEHRGPGAVPGRSRAALTFDRGEGVALDGVAARKDRAVGADLVVPRPERGRDGVFDDDHIGIGVVKLELLGRSLDLLHTNPAKLDASQPGHSVGNGPRDPRAGFLKAHQKAQNLHGVLRADRGQLKGSGCSRLKSLFIVLLAPARLLNLALQDAGHAPRDRLAGFVAPRCVQPGPVRLAIRNVFQQAEITDRHAVVEGNVARIALRARPELWKAAHRKLGRKDKVQPALDRLVPGVVFEQRRRPRQIVELRVDIVVIKRRVRALLRRDNGLLLRVGEDRSHVKIAGPAATLTLEKQDIQGDLPNLRGRIAWLLGAGGQDHPVFLDLAPVARTITKAIQREGRKLGVIQTHDFLIFDTLFYQEIMTILYIEDEEELADLVALALRRAGYTVEHLADGQRGWERAQEGGFALILLDGMLPGMDGLEICRRLRLRRDRTPILMLTARETSEDQVRGLETGADDYLVKPFSLEVLLAHIRALLRREGAHKSSAITIRDIAIDLSGRTLTRAGLPVTLTPREWKLLEVLVQSEGRTVSREKILQRAWDAEEKIGSNMVDVYIKQLRQKLDSDSEQKLIHTVHGSGYALLRPREESTP